MDKYNENKLGQLINAINAKKIKMYFADIPQQYKTVVKECVNLRTMKKYDESLAKYLQIIDSYGSITTEICRSMVKTLFAMNEYFVAMALLAYAANTQWTSVSKAPKEMYLINPTLAKSMEIELPTASAADFYEMRDNIKAVINNDFAPLFNKTKFVSGQSDYKNEKTNYEIQEQAKKIVKHLGIS